MGKFMKKFVTTCGKTLDEPGLIERLRDEKFDVYIAQNFDYCGIGANFHSFNWIIICLYLFSQVSPIWSSLRRSSVPLLPHSTDIFSKIWEFPRHSAIGLVGKLLQIAIFQYSWYHWIAENNFTLCYCSDYHKSSDDANENASHSIQPPTCPLSTFIPSSIVHGISTRVMPFEVSLTPFDRTWTTSSRKDSERIIRLLRLVLSENRKRNI